MSESLRFSGGTSHEVTVHIDGEPMRCRLGETVASALIANRVRLLRHSPRDRRPRGAFCMMGVCQECVAWVDGAWRQTCQTSVVDGMAVELDRTP